MKRYYTALTIAGSDSGGCAGIQADLKTFSALGVFGTSVITALTAQNTCEVAAVEVASQQIIEQQIKAVFSDMSIDALKTGMLPTPEIIDLVADAIDRYSIQNTIVDPVMISTSGFRLAQAETVSSFRKLMSKVMLITPNIPEAEVLTGIRIESTNDMAAAAEILIKEGCRAVLIKGGHLRSASSSDILFRADCAPVEYSSPHIDTQNLHGTGCTLSSAIAAYMALGCKLEQAVGLSKEYISAAILHGQQITTGKGHGPVNHFFAPEELKIKLL